MPKTYLLNFLILLTLFSCSNRSAIEEEVVDEEIEIRQRDLPDILSSDTIKAVSCYGPSSYFLYRGEALGFEYELLKEVAAELNVHLQLIVCNNIDSLFTYLDNGEADLLAYGLTVTSERKKHYDFSLPYQKNHQVLVQRKVDNYSKLSYSEKKKSLIQDVTELAGRRISIRKNSSYDERIKNLSQEIGDSIYVEYVDGSLSTYEIIEKLSEGEYDLTIADVNIAKLNAAYFHNIDASLPLSLSQNIAFALSKNSGELKVKVDSIVANWSGSAKFNMLYNKYFESTRSFKKRVDSDFYSLTSGKISPYDDLIKKYSEDEFWDWKLLASLIYQESRFDAKAGSWAGAKGLMQLMPQTAKSLGVKHIYDPEDNIRGGLKYLKKLALRWNELPDSLDQVKFTLASFNCGPGHVLDAQRLAKELNLDPMVWDDSVEKCILLLMKKEYYTRPEIQFGYVRGSESAKYVKDILARFEEYMKILPET